MPTVSNKAPAPRPTITLLSDFGIEDWYVATMKAVLLRYNPAARLIDVTHHIPAGDVLRGSIALERAIAAFGPETVHLAVVDPGVGSGRRLLVVSIHNQWVVCPDNGLITWALRHYPDAEFHEITWRPPHPSSTFHGRDILAPAAAAIGAGVPLKELGRPIVDPILLDVFPAPADASTGQIIHFDRFGNATTNIPATALLNRSRVNIAVAGRHIGPIHNTYSDVEPGETLALVGSSALLEIAVRDGSAKNALSLRMGDTVDILNPEYSTEELRRLDKAHVWHPFTHMQLWLESDPLVITDAQGMHLIDSDGNRYLDGVSSLWCNVHGHRVPEIDQAIRLQLERFAHSTMLGLAAEPAIALAGRLMRIVPVNLKKVFFSDCGAAAAEIAFKIAVQYWHNIGQPQRTEFVAFSDAYHGDTFGAMSVGRTELFHRSYYPLLFKTHYAPSPFVYRPPAELVKAGEFPSAEQVNAHCLAKLEAILRENNGRIAAIVIEPLVQGAAGMIVHPDGFLAEVRRLATQYNTLLICDEVAVGFGRTGRMFASEHEQVQPDLMAVAKGLTGGYLPLAATFATQAIFDAFLGKPMEGRTFFHGHTYTGNALACAAAIASLELFRKHRLVERVQRNAEELARLLAPLRELPCVGDIRQKGLMAGIELVADKAMRRPFDPARRLGHQVCMNLRAQGIILRPLGDTIVLMPPLAMELDDMQSIVIALKQELAAITP
ncbi:MAG: adenosylmethionine--8-amino-7-oxononanoate transaminase [Tepidisphaerales bacterium]